MAAAGACSTIDQSENTPDQGSSANELKLTRSQYKNGRYSNPWPGFKIPVGPSTLWRLLRTKNNTCLPSNKQELDETLPVVKPDLEELKVIPNSGVKVVWLGHACVLVQFDGISVLTDPVFSQRCSFTQWLGPKRFNNTPCTINELPTIDAVVISHNHYDHLDYNTVLELNKRFGTSLKWFVPLGLKSWFEDSGCKNVEEMDWWQECELINKQGNAINFACVPSQHWSNRGVMDRFKTLWCGWVIKSSSHSFYFAGDTGYCDVFKQIGDVYGPFDLAAIPIGAYEPRWLTQCQHVDPEQAVLIHKDVQSKKSVGIHWGTFALAFEHYLEPPQKLKESLEANGLSEQDFFVLKHGEGKLV